MDKIKNAMSTLDRRVDKHIGFVKNFFNKYFPVISTLALVLIMLVFVIRIFYSRPRIVASLIEDDIAQITLALEKIDADCNILTIEDVHNEINFLNVKTFAKSQVGPLSLAYPKKWKGPYLNVNPTLQGMFYEIVQAQDGLFVVPGRGVRLPNGLEVGKDFQIAPESKVSELIQKGGPLYYEGSVFAAKLIFQVGDWDPWLMRKATIRKLDRMLKEFHTAMPYAHNEANEHRV